MTTHVCKVSIFGVYERSLCSSKWPIERAKHFWLNVAAKVFEKREKRRKQKSFNPLLVVDAKLLLIVDPVLLEESTHTTVIKELSLLHTSGSNSA